MARTILTVLKGINAYPLPEATIYEKALKRGLDVDAEATAETISSKAYKLTKADLFMYLAFAPAVSQGGQSYSFTDEQRTLFRNWAKQIYAEFEEQEEEGTSNLYGYKGDRL